MKRPNTILIVNRGEPWLEFSRNALRRAGFWAEAADSLTKASCLLRQRRFELVLLDSAFLRYEEPVLINEFLRPQNVVVLSASPSVQEIRDAFKLARISDYSPKPFSEGKLIELVRSKLERIEER